MCRACVQSPRVLLLIFWLYVYIYCYSAVCFVINRAFLFWNIGVDSTNVSALSYTNDTTRVNGFTPANESYARARARVTINRPVHATVPRKVRARWRRTPPRVSFMLLLRLVKTVSRSAANRSASALLEARSLYHARSPSLAQHAASPDRAYPKIQFKVNTTCIVLDNYLALKKKQICLKSKLTFIIYSGVRRITKITDFTSIRCTRR